jgi:hypothetical protein
MAGHSFRNHFFEEEIYISLDDCINAMLLEAENVREMEEKTILLATAQFFAKLKKVILDGRKAGENYTKKIQEEEKTWWGKTIWNVAKKKRWL